MSDKITQTSIVKPYMPEHQIKLAIADDHALFRSGLRRILESNPRFAVKLEAGSGEQLLELMSRQKVDVVLSDVSMRDMDGIKLTRMISKDYKQVRVIGISMHDSLGIIKQMIAAGACGYLVKDSAPDELMMAIVQVYEGKLFFSRNVMETLVDVIADRSKFIPANAFNPRAMQLMRLIFEENSDQEIAGKMEISLRSVSKIKKDVIEQLGVDTVAGLVKRIMEERILD